MSNPQPPAAPVASITPEKIAALRDALAKATQGEWFALTVEPTQLSGSHSACGTGYGLLQGPKMVQVHKADAFTPQDATAIALAHNLAPKLLAALDAAEAARAKVQQEADGYKAALKALDEAPEARTACILQFDPAGGQMRVFGPTPGREIEFAKTFAHYVNAIDAVAKELALKKADAEIAQLKGALDAAEQRAALAQQQAAGYQAAIKREADMCAAATAAEAKAMEFAWDALAFAGVCVNSESGIYNDCANSSAESAAEYLADRGLLRKTGERTWQRVEER